MLAATSVISAGAADQAAAAATVPATVAATDDDAAATVASESAVVGVSAAVGPVGVAMATVSLLIPLANGRPAQVDTIKIHLESAHGFSARSFNMTNRTQTLLSFNLRRYTTGLEERVRLLTRLAPRWPW